MSAQAVLSIMAPALPATPQGSSGADPSGFGDLLATALSEEKAASSAAPGKGPSLAEVAPEADEASVRGEQEAAKFEDPTATPPAVPALPVPKSEMIPEPQVLPGEITAKGTEPFVLPGEITAKGAEPLVLPGTPVAKGTEPQVLPGTATAKGLEPLVLPGAEPPKGTLPLILPGAGQGKGRQSQVPPGEATIDAAPPSRNGDMMPEAPSADQTAAPASSRPGAVPAPPSLPPLRALAERTSKPLDDAGEPAETAPAADRKTTGATSTPVTAQTGAPVKTAAAGPTTVPAVDTPSAPTDAGPAGEPVSTSTEAAAPVRDHALSTLSRATIDATAQIAAQILRKLEGRSTRFEIALRPAELGRVDVKLDIDSEGRLAARLAFDNPAAATDLRGRADELRRQLEAAGFQLADDAFEFAERDSGSSAFDRGQDARHGQNRAFAAAARLKSEIDVAQPPQWLALSLSPTGVDMKV